MRRLPISRVISTSTSFRKAIELAALGFGSDDEGSSDGVGEDEAWFE
jgi:hypothetical protein